MKQPLAELLPADLILEENARWQKVDTLVSQIETADERLRTYDSQTGQVQPLQGVQTMETDEFRIRLVPQADLAKELAEKGESAKWGLYIRAPQVYFDLLQQAGDKFVPLSEVAEVRRGYTTGINDFFYLEPLGSGEKPGTLRVKNSRGWVGEIEEACLRPVIKSPKEAKSMVVDPASLKYRLFLPPIDPKADDLEVELRMAYPLAYQYVRWGAQQRTSQGQPWQNVPSVRGRKAWWLIREPTIPDGLWPKSFNDKFAIYRNPDQVLSSDRFYELIVQNDSNISLLFPLLNSSLLSLMLEINSRVNLGEGALDNMTYEAGLNTIILPEIITSGLPILEREILPIPEELKQSDRQQIEEALCYSLGLTKVELDSLQEELIKLSANRLERAGS